MYDSRNDNKGSIGLITEPSSSDAWSVSERRLREGFNLLVCPAEIQPLDLSLVKREPMGILQQINKLDRMAGQRGDNDATTHRLV